MTAKRVVAAKRDHHLLDLSFLIVQALNGLASASSLFIIAAGLTIVFGVTRIVNFATVCGSLREALDNLDKNRDFLKKGGVFTDDMIDAYLELKMAEVERFEMTPHPVEFDMYYSV